MGGAFSASRRSCETARQHTRFRASLYSSINCLEGGRKEEGEGGKGGGGGEVRRGRVEGGGGRRRGRVKGRKERGGKERIQYSTEDITMVDYSKLQATPL